MDKANRLPRFNIKDNGDHYENLGGEWVDADDAIATIEALEAENAALEALFAGKVLCDQQSIAAISTSSEEVVATLDAAYFGTNWTPLYAPASLAGNADIGNKACTHAPAQATTHWDHGTEVSNLFCVKCGADIGKPEPDYKALYNELLYQVATVVPGESRYQTALRYIREREDRCNAQRLASLPEGEG